MPHARDLALVHAVLSADRSAFDRLYERLFLRVSTYVVRRLGRGAKAEAVAAASLAEFFDGLPGYGGEISLEALAFEIVQRRAANALATSARPLAMARPGDFPGAHAAPGRPVHSAR